MRCMSFYIRMSGLCEYYIRYRHILILKTKRFDETKIPCVSVFICDPWYIEIINPHFYMSLIIYARLFLPDSPIACGFINHFYHSTF